MPSPQESRVLHCAAMSHLYQLLSLVSGPVEESLMIQARDGQNRVELKIARQDQAGALDRGMPGAFLSPLEMLVWNALANGPLPGKTVAEVLGLKHDGKVKFCLANLVEREVLVVTEDGYARADRATAA